MTRPVGQILRAATVCVVLVACGGGESAGSLASWACERIGEGADPDRILSTMVEEQAAAGVPDRDMAWALWDGCGLELGLEPPPGTRP